ncbi:S41 family peptidase [Spirosoma pollinicola]|uniref:Peptidase S41 n=1 Tax=Spirosoma pollinicola TaxID=2057025 RepID=A0A2K8Z023_9BACT|nr:S41 family peptidase [Spirosoma pollinicola]AUD03246.1 peptidase S41 [Spirosoma pollinicola]
MRNFFVWRSALLFMASSLLVVTSCKKSTDVTPTGPVTDKEVNGWILDNMKTYYYWNDKLPVNPDVSLTPDVFFKSLLNTYDVATNPTGDRFSWIQESADELKASLNGETKTDGIEYKLYLRTASSNDVIGKILYVQKGSPAAKAGLKRGDIFYQINGQTLNTGNYIDLVYSTSDTKTYTLASVDATNAIVNTTTTRQTTAVVFQANPVFLDSVYTIKGKTIGYFVYNQFATGPTGADDHTYDNQVDAVFARFKTKGVTDLVLDLRYNPGGYVTAAQNLGSLIGKGVDPSKIFYKKEYSKTLTASLTASYGADWFNGYFLQKSSNIGANLRTLTILTTGGTASASELVINGLRPFMDVTTIGSTTYGKNVGSITISDEKGRIKWGMQPIVTKTFNSLNQSDYSTGFKPSVEVKEYSNEVWKQLGDVNESMLSTAIARITGAGRVAAHADGPTFELGSSIDRRAGRSNMFFRDKLPAEQH